MNERRYIMLRLRHCFAALLLLALLQAARPVAAQQPFDLDLSTLKKLTMPTPSGKRAPLSAPLPKKARIKRAAPAVQPAAASPVTVPSPEKLQRLQRLPSPETIPSPAFANVFRIPVSVPPCELLPKLLTAFPISVPTAEALRGVPLAAPYAVRHNTIVLAVACGLAEAEEVTFSRLLELQGSRLMNIVGTDSAETVAGKLAGSLDRAVQLMRASSPGARQMYVFPAGIEPGFFIIFSSDSTTGKPGQPNLNNTQE